MRRPAYAPTAGGSVADELIYRSRLIGSQPDLVVHGGGNTSSKTIGRDHLGRSRPILTIKASGADLATLAASGLCDLYLDDMLALRVHERMDDAEMQEHLALCVARRDVPPPSIETLLHAFIPARYVDHVHADAVCALTRSPTARETIRAALGPEVAFVEWIRPGFDLAKIVGGLASGGIDAVVLAHHGLVCWADEPGGAVRRTYDLVERAERFLTLAARSSTAAVRQAMSDTARRDLLLRLRGRVSRRGHRILHVDTDGRRIADRDDVRLIAEAGAATADHLMHARPWSVVLPPGSDIDACVSDFEERYRAFWESERGSSDAQMHDPRPTVFLVPSLGTITAGRSSDEARRIADIAAHTHGVAATAIDAFADIARLGAGDVFGIDYWPLELAKQARRPPPGEFEGRVFIVTGAASGIGRCTALALAERRAHLVINDIDGDALAEVTANIGGAGPCPVQVVGDVSSEATVAEMIDAAVDAFGGVDGAVSNAGVAVAGPLSEVDRAEWERSMAVNATSHFLVVRHLLRALARQGIGGSVVFVASKNAFAPGEGFGPYSVAKAAEVQIARMTALEGGPLGIRANIVSPDAVFDGSRLWTSEIRAARAAAHGVTEGQLADFYASRNLLQARIRCQDVAEAVCFLLSDRASRTTGCVLTVDGGLVSTFPR